MRQAKKQESVVCTQRKAVTGNFPWGSPDIGLTRQRLCLL